MCEEKGLGVEVRGGKAWAGEGLGEGERGKVFCVGVAFAGGAEAVREQVSEDGGHGRSRKCGQKFVPKIK